MVVVYCDLAKHIHIIGSHYKLPKIKCDQKTVKITFVDGTVIHAGYPKKEKPICWIHVTNKGSAWQNLRICNNENDQYCSDIFEIDSEIQSHELQSVS